MIYGYCRISRKEQNIERQVRNIEKEYPKKEYPDVVIIKEAFTGTKIEGRKEFEKLIEKVKSGDTIIFDSVSRMSRNAEEGISLYFDLFNRNVNLVFLKEKYINTEIYQENLRDKIALIGTDEDEIFKGINNYFRKLAAKQIRIAFDQAEKEVNDLHERTKEGIETARLNGKQIGQRKGNKLHVKKKDPAKEVMRKHCKDFGGNLTDKEVMKLADLSRNTFYRYKTEIKEELL